MFFIFNGDGQLTLHDIYRECQKERWVPILVYQKDGVTMVPAFNSESVAKNFVRRNMPPAGMWGGVVLTDEDMDAMRERGWVIEEFSYPRKMKDLVTFEVEVIELNEEPMVVTHRK